MKKLICLFLPLLDPMVTFAGPMGDGPFLTLTDILWGCLVIIIFPLATLFFYIYPVAKKINRRPNKFIYYRLVFNLIFWLLWISWVLSISTSAPAREDLFSGDLAKMRQVWHRNADMLHIINLYFTVVILVDAFVIGLRRRIK